MLEVELLNKEEQIVKIYYLTRFLTMFEEEDLKIFLEVRDTAYWVFYPPRRYVPCHPLT